jgi:hypothetical protein
MEMETEEKEEFLPHRFTQHSLLRFPLVIALELISPSTMGCYSGMRDIGEKLSWWMVKNYTIK